MATRRFMVNPGEQFESVTEASGAATATKSIELTVDLANTIVYEGDSTRTINKEEVLIALELFKQYIGRQIWPPA